MIVKHCLRIFWNHVWKYLVLWKKHLWCIGIWTNNKNVMFSNYLKLLKQDESYLPYFQQFISYLTLRSHVAIVHPPTQVKLVRHLNWKWKLHTSSKSTWNESCFSIDLKLPYKDESFKIRFVHKIFLDIIWNHSTYWKNIEKL